MHFCITMGRMTNETFTTWLAKHTNNATARQIGERITSSYSTVNRQLSGQSDLSASLVIEIARGYGLNVLEALVVAGFISEAEADAPPVDMVLKLASDVELAKEILRRAEDGDESMERPVSEIANDDGNVISADHRFGAFSAPNGLEPDLEGEEFAADVRRDHEDDPIDND